LKWERAAAYPELFAAQTGALPPDPGSHGSDSEHHASDADYALQHPTGPPNNPASNAPKWRYEKNGQPSDPTSFDQIRTLAAQGIIQPDGLVWNDTLPNWIHARDVPGVVFPSVQEHSFHPSPRPVREASSERTGLTPLSQLAVASFVCGVVGVSSVFFIPLGLLAVIFGHVSLYTRRVQSGELRGKGLAIAGLTVGWCCLLILPIVAYFVLVALSAASI